MKKGKSYITYTEQDKHPLIVALKEKGFSNIHLVFAPVFSPNFGWDLIQSDKRCIGWDGWLGFTKNEALRTIDRIEIKDNDFAYLK